LRDGFNLAGADGKKADPAWIVLLLLLGSLLYMPEILAGKTVLIPAGENLSQWWPYRAFIKESYASGSFPLWCPYLYCGLPFAGWSHSGAFYPLGFFYFLFDFVKGTSYNFGLHLSICLAGFYLMSRTFGARPHAAGPAAAWFGFGFYAARGFENFLPFVFSMSLCPWVIMSLARLFQTRSLRRLCLAAAAVTLQVLGGHLELIAHQFLLFGIGAFVWAALARKNGARGLFLLAAPVLMASLAGMVLLLPSLEYVHRSIRSLPMNYELFTEYASPRFIIYNADYGQFNLLFLLAFAAGAARVFRDRLAAVCVVLILFCVIYTGNLFDIQRLFHRLPVFSRMLFPWRMNFMEYLVAGLVAAFGIDSMLRSRSRGLWLLAAAVVLVFSLVFNPGDEVNAPAGGPALPLVTYKHTVQKAYHTAAPWLAAAAAGAIVLSLLLRRAGMRRREAEGIFLVALFLGQWSLPMVLSSPGHEPSDYAVDPDYAAFAGRAGKERMLNITRPGAFPLTRIPPQSGVLYGAHSINGYISIPLLSYAGYIKSIFDKAYVLEEGELREINIVFVFNMDGFIREEKIPLMDFLNLRYLVTGARNAWPATEHELLFNDYLWKDIKGNAAPDPFAEPPSLAGEPPYKAVHPDLFIEKDASIELGTSVGGRAGAFLAVVARPQDGSVPALVFSRSFAGPAGPAKERRGAYSVRMGGIASDSTLYDLEILALPLEDKEERGTASFLSPVLHTPSHHFKKLPLGGLRVFVNPSAMPQAFITHEVKVLPEMDERISFLGGGSFRPYQQVVLEEEPGVRLVPSRGRRGKEWVRTDTYESDRMTLLVRASRPGHLVLSHVYYPGWRAYIDGVERRVLRANQAFRALPIESGTHRVAMVYKPFSFRVGLWASLASVAVLAGLAFRRGLFKRAS